MLETRVPSLGWKDALEKEMATHSSTLAMENPMTEATVHGVAKSQTRLSNFTYFLSCALSKSSLNIWKFTVHVQLKLGLENLGITLLACEMSATVQ